MIAPPLPGNATAKSEQRKAIPAVRCSLFASPLKVPVARAAPVPVAGTRLLGGTERAKGPKSERSDIRGSRARRGKGPGAVVYGDDRDERRGNLRVIATCALEGYVDRTRRGVDGRPMGLIPCVTAFERAHDLRDRNGRLEPNAIGGSRDPWPLPGSRPRLYPPCLLTSAGSQGGGGHSYDGVCDETEMRARRLSVLLNGKRAEHEWGSDVDGPGYGHRAGEALSRMDPAAAEVLCTLGGMAYAVHGGNGRADG